MADPITTGRQIYDYFIARGLSPHQAAAIAGNMAHESGGNPGAVNIGDNTRRSPYAPHSFGLSQWNGPRLAGLVDYARQQGARIPQGDLRDPAYVRGLGQYLPLQTQLGYAWNEMQGPEADAYRRITAAPDLSTAVAGAVGYHRPQGYTSERPEMSLGYSGRLSLADQIMRARSQPDAPLSASGVPIVAAAQMMAPPPPRREVSMPPILSGVPGFKDGGAVATALRIAARQTDTNPTDAQKEAGNYAKGKVRLHGMEIAIENPKGSTRSGTDKDGKTWRCTLPAHYGDIKRSLGADGDAVDCYIGDAHKSDRVFVVDQIDAKTGKFDEHKIMLSFPSKRDALAAYEKAFSDGRGRDRIGSVSEMSVDGFRDWLKSGTTKKPVGDLRKTFADGGSVQPYSSRLAELMLNARPYYRSPVERVPPVTSFEPGNLPLPEEGRVRVLRDPGGDDYNMLPWRPGTYRVAPVQDWLKTGGSYGILPPALPQTTDRSGALGKGILPGPQASLDFARGGPIPMTKRYADGGAPDADLVPGGLPPLPAPPETELDRYHARQAALDALARRPPLPPSMLPTLGRESPASRSGQMPITTADIADFAMQTPQGLNRGVDSLANLPWNLLVRGPAALAGYDLPEGRYFSRANSERPPTTELGAAGGVLGEAIPGIATAGPQWVAMANAARGLAGGLATGYRALPPGSIPAGLASVGAMTVLPGEASTQANRRDPLEAEIQSQQAIIAQANKDIQKLNDRTWPTRTARENATAPYAAQIQRAQDEITRINGERRAAREQARTATQTQRDAQIAEAEAARRRILDEAPTPFQNTMLGRHWGAAPLVMGGITGAIAGARHSIGDRFAVGRLANAIADASAAGRTSQGFRAGNEARNLSEALPRHNGLLAQHLDHMRVPAIVGGLEGLAAPNLPNAWNAMTQPPVNPEYSGLQAYLRLLPPDVEGQPALQARARALLEDRTALPEENPFYRGAIDYYSSGRWLPSMLGSALEGAGSAAFTSGLTGAFAPTPARIAALRAQTEALPQPPPPRGPRGPRDQGSPPPGGPPPGGLPPPPPSAAPAPAAAPPAALSPPSPAAPATPAPGALSNATPSDPPHHSHLQPRRRGQFAGPPKAPSRARNPEQEAIDHHSNPDRLTRGQKNGGLVNRALELARKFGGRAKFADGGAPSANPYGEPRFPNMDPRAYFQPPDPNAGSGLGHFLEQALRYAPLGIGSRVGARAMGPTQAELAEAYRVLGAHTPQPRPPVPRMTNEEAMRWFDSQGLSGASDLIRKYTPNAMPLDPRADAMLRFNSMQPPPRSRMHANGGHVSEGSGPVVAGPILGTDGGRDDELNRTVKSGSFVVPAHVVSGLPGAGSNTLAGMRMLEQYFGKPSPHAMASGGATSDVPIKISSGEFVISPDQVAKVGGGSLENGHRVLDAFCKQVQKQHAKEVARLPAPAKD